MESTPSRSITKPPGPTSTASSRQATSRAKSAAGVGSFAHWPQNLSHWISPMTACAPSRPSTPAAPTTEKHAVKPVPTQPTIVRARPAARGGVSKQHQGTRWSLRLRACVASTEWIHRPRHAAKIFQQRRGVTWQGDEQLPSLRGRGIHAWHGTHPPSGRCARRARCTPRRPWRKRRRSPPGARRRTRPSTRGRRRACRWRSEGSTGRRRRPARARVQCVSRDGERCWPQGARCPTPGSTITLLPQLLGTTPAPRPYEFCGQHVRREPLMTSRVLGANVSSTLARLVSPLRWSAGATSGGTSGPCRCSPKGSPASTRGLRFCTAL